MTTIHFDPDNTLAGGLFALTPREAICLGIDLCTAAEAAVGADGCHGTIWPGNISQSDGKIALGPSENVKVSDMSPDALEFLSPEQFWNGSSSPASDVYSIGLILYTALNGGVMPFFAPDAAHTPEARADALQNRMKGAELPYPRSAGRELGEIVAKAIAFQAEARYAKPAALKLALESLPEGAAVPAVAPVLPLTEKEVQNVHSYKVDKDFETIVPDKPKKSHRTRRDVDEVDENMDADTFRTTQKRKGRWILPTILLILIAASLILLLRGCNDYDERPEFPIETDAHQEGPVAPGSPDPIHPPVPTAAPTPVEPTAEPTPPPGTVDEPAAPKYEIFLENVTWEQAKLRCEEKGGHLATVRSAEQLAEVIELAEKNGASFVWLGAYRAENNHWYYVTGDALSYTAWDTGEPSAMDQDGTREDYLLLWFRKAVGTWSYNDMRNDPVAIAPGTYAGKLAYICQYDN
ncbi:MAG: hypothetical protein E7472_05040 [Ruminococcaceae bacterium]|nr:hypothetical protein [Oscillospiraceae bacterium]